MFKRQKPEQLGEPLRFPTSGNDEVVARRRGHMILNPLRLFGHKTRFEQYDILKAGPPGAEGLTMDEYMSQRGHTMVDDLRRLLGDEAVEQIAEEAAESGWTLDDQEQLMRSLVEPRVESVTYTRDLNSGQWNQR